MWVQIMKRTAHVRMNEIIESTAILSRYNRRQYPAFCKNDSFANVLSQPQFCLRYFNQSVERFPWILFE